MHLAENLQIHESPAFGEGDCTAGVVTHKRRSYRKRLPRFFEEYPVVFESLGYIKVHQHLRLEAQEVLIPDFLLARLDGTYEICDIKTPGEKVIKQRENREEFYAKISTEYAGQLRCYAEFFDDAANRSAFAKKYGVVVNKSPNRFLIVGRDDGFDRHQLHQIIKSRGNEFGLLTYDDVLRALRWHQAMSDFGTEQRFGVSLTMVLKFFEVPTDSEYVLDFFEPDTGERLSVIATPLGQIRIFVENGQGRTDSFTVDHFPGGSSFGDWHYLQFMLGTRTDYSRCELRLDGHLIESRELNYNFFKKRGANYRHKVIGADFQESRGAAFELSYLKIHNYYINFADRVLEDNRCLARISELENGTVPVYRLEKHGHMRIRYWEGTKVPISPAVEAFYDSITPPSPSASLPLD